MARKPDDDGKAVKRPDRGAELQQEQEQEQEQEASQDHEAPEHARLQDQFGNQALVNINSQSDIGSAGVAVESSARKQDEEKEGVEHGGDEDPVDATVYETEDLTQSWNPTTVHPTERPEFLDCMPMGEMPQEEKEFLSQIRHMATLTDWKGSTSLDPYVQPSAITLDFSLSTWTRAITPWASTKLTQRCWARIIRNPPSWLHDPYGRPSIIRARGTNLALTLLLSAPVLSKKPTVETCAYLSFLLELSARSNRLAEVRGSISDPKARPSCADLLTEHVSPLVGRVTPTKMANLAMDMLNRCYEDLMALEDPTGFVPELTLPKESEPDPNDPLGIDDIIRQNTKTLTTPIDHTYRNILKAAERIAVSSNLLQIRIAGLLVAVADVARLWSSGVPGELLLIIAHRLDEDIKGAMQNLRNVARSTQSQDIEIHELCETLRTISRQLNSFRKMSKDRISTLIGAMLPGEPKLVLPSRPKRDVLYEAWEDGKPAGALEWLQRKSQTTDRDNGIALVKFASAQDPQSALDGLLPFYERIKDSDPLLSSDLRTCISSCALWTEQPELALAMAKEQRELGISRRNGIMVADAAFMEMEARLLQNDEGAAQESRLKYGRIVWSLGAQAGVSLLARWSPPVIQ